MIFTTDIAIRGYTRLTASNRSEIRSDATGFGSRNGDVTIQADEITLSERVVGGTAERILRHSPCPTLVA